jgi:hypothetical protein
VILMQHFADTPGSAIPSIPLSFSLATILSPHQENLNLLRVILLYLPLNCLKRDE